jgi:hypothetical protein
MHGPGLSGDFALFCAGRHDPSSAQLPRSLAARRRIRGELSSLPGNPRNDGFGSIAEAVGTVLGASPRSELPGSAMLKRAESGATIL